VRREPFMASLLGLLSAGAWLPAGRKRAQAAQTDDMMNSMTGGSMMNVSRADMQIYVEMFDHHREIRRTVEHLPNGIRAVTESDNQRIAALLKQHVPDMYGHLSGGQEVRCMSNSLPTMFRNASHYQRHVRLTARGVEVVETSGNPEVVAAIRRHAEEVTGFVRDGMPAMMRSMMQ
jgi:hypothetical protein